MTKNSAPAAPAAPAANIDVAEINWRAGEIVELLKRRTKGTPALSEMLEVHADILRGIIEDELLQDASWFKSSC